MNITIKTLNRNVLMELPFLKQNNNTNDDEEDDEEEFFLCVTFALFAKFYLHSLQYHIVLQFFAYRSLFLDVPE